MRIVDSQFFACKGYALAALGVLAWAAKALQEGEGADFEHARIWVAGGAGMREAPLSFEVSVQAIGLSSRREQLRSTFITQPAEAMAHLLRLEHAMQTEDPGVSGDEVLEVMRSMRAIHLDGAGLASPSPRTLTASESAC